MITRLGRFNEKKLQKIFNKKVYLNWLKHISNLPFIVSCLRQRWTSKAERLYWLCRLSSSWKTACSGLVQANPLLFFGLNPSFPFPYIEWHMYDFGRKKFRIIIDLGTVYFVGILGPGPSAENVKTIGSKYSSEASMSVFPLKYVVNIHKQAYS